jgi:hypothetical protein
MLIAYKMQVSNLLKRTFRYYASNCKLLAETASFRGISKLFLKAGTSATFLISNAYILVKNLQKSYKKVVTPFIRSLRSYLRILAKRTISKSTRTIIIKNTLKTSLLVTLI